MQDQEWPRSREPCSVSFYQKSHPVIWTTSFIRLAGRTRTKTQSNSPGHTQASIRYFHGTDRITVPASERLPLLVTPVGQHGNRELLPGLAIRVEWGETARMGESVYCQPRGREFLVGLKVNDPVYDAAKPVPSTVHADQSISPKKSE